MSADESCCAAIDYIYDAFVTRLKPELRACARDLTHRLGLSEEPGRCWSEALDDPRLELPLLLFGDLRRPISEDVCIAALRAHVFAFIASLIHERIDRHELDADGELCGVLLVLEHERDLIVTSLCEMGERPRLDCHLAQREARDALARERRVFEGLVGARMDDFVASSVGKASPLFPAMLACGAASKLDVLELGHIHEIIVGLSLGIAARDEVRDWFERAQFGRSWAASMVEEGRERHEVFVSLVNLAVDSLVRAAAAAHALDAVRVASWALAQAEGLQRLLGRRELGRGNQLARAMR